MNSLGDLLNKKSDDLMNKFQISSDDTNSDDNRGPQENQGHFQPINTDESDYTQNDTVEETPAETPLIEHDINIVQLKNTIYKIKDELDGIIRILDGHEVQTKEPQDTNADVLGTGEQIIEGVFNGEKMIGPDGKEYSVPPNYASKSKLVEGDMMKLTITNKGSFIYKQIGPVERDRIKGELVSDSTGNTWTVLADGKTYKILTASVTYYKGNSGDEVILLVPQDSESEWGAVDNIVTNSQ